MALPPDDKKKSADQPTEVSPELRTTPPPLSKSPAYSEARKAAIAQATERQRKGSATASAATTPGRAETQTGEKDQPATRLRGLPETGIAESRTLESKTLKTRTLETGALENGTAKASGAEDGTVKTKTPTSGKGLKVERGEYPEIKNTAGVKGASAASTGSNRLTRPSTATAATTAAATAATSATSATITDSKSETAKDAASAPKTLLTRETKSSAETDTKTDVRTIRTRSGMTDSQTGQVEAEAGRRTSDRDPLGPDRSSARDPRRPDRDPRLEPRRGEPRGQERGLRSQQQAPYGPDRAPLSREQERRSRGQTGERPAGPPRSTGDRQSSPPNYRPAARTAAPRRKMGPPPASARKGAIVRRGKPVAYHTINPATPNDGSPWGPLLLGLLLLAAVAWYAVKHYTPQIEEDLARRSNDALMSEGLTDANVNIDGRTAILTGSVDNRNQLNLAEETVAGTFGIRAVDNQLNIGGSATTAIEDRQQPSLSLSQGTDQIELTGTVSDSRYATAIENAANEHFGADQVSASISIDESTTNPGWTSGVSQLLPALENIDNGALSIDDGTLTLTGASDAESKAEIDALATALVGGQLEISNLIAAPEPVVEEQIAEVPTEEAVAEEAAQAAPEETAAQEAAEAAPEETVTQEATQAAPEETVTQEATQAAPEETAAEEKAAEAVEEATAEEAVAATDEQTPAEEEPAPEEQTTAEGVVPGAENNATESVSNADADTTNDNASVTDQQAAPATDSSDVERSETGSSDTENSETDAVEPEETDATQTVAADSGAEDDGAANTTAATEEPSVAETESASVAPAKNPELPAFAAIRDSGDSITVSGFMSPDGAEQLLSSLGSEKPITNNINVDDRVETPAWSSQLASSLDALSTSGVANPAVTMTRAGNIKLSGVVESDEAKSAAADAISAVYGDEYKITNDLDVVVPPPVPTLAPFASVSAVDDTVTITGLLPPATAKSISSSYRAAGKSVIENVTRDERVIEPEWTDAFAQVADGMADVENGTVIVSSGGAVTLKGTVESDSAKEAVSDNVTALFGDSVSLRNDIRVTPTIVPADELQQMFESIDLSAIRFDTNSAELTDSSVGILDSVADALLAIPGVDVEIGGHTDSAGSYDYNLTLSTQRAEAVQDYLTSKGVDGDRLQSTGFGPSRPVASNETRAGRALNRRIELEISGE